MNRLEEKLIELGYKYNNYDDLTCEKEYIKLVVGATLYIYVPKIYDDYYGMCVADNKVLNQNIINTHQQAFNTLKQDLEVLREYEKIDKKYQ